MQGPSDCASGEREKYVHLAPFEVLTLDILPWDSAH